MLYFFEVEPELNTNLFLKSLISALAPTVGIVFATHKNWKR
jgi:hypothetical protein